MGLPIGWATPRTKLRTASPRRRQTATDLAGKAQTAAADAASTIQDAAGETVRQVRDTATKAYGQGAQAAEYLSRNTAEQPLLGLLIAAAVGYGVAYIIHGR